jgi:hypothetical protein
MQQGIFSAEQGIFLTEQGKSTSDQGSPLKKWWGVPGETLIDDVASGAGQWRVCR